MNEKSLHSPNLDKFLKKSGNGITSNHASSKVIQIFKERWASKPYSIFLCHLPAILNIYEGNCLNSEDKDFLQSCTLYRIENVLEMLTIQKLPVKFFGSNNSNESSTLCTLERIKRDAKALDKIKLKDANNYLGLNWEDRYHQATNQLDQLITEAEKIKKDHKGIIPRGKEAAKSIIAYQFNNNKSEASRFFEAIIDDLRKNGTKLQSSSNLEIKKIKSHLKYEDPDYYPPYEEIKDLLCGKVKSRKK